MLKDIRARAVLQKTALTNVNFAARRIDGAARISLGFFNLFLCLTCVILRKRC